MLTGKQLAKQLAIISMANDGVESVNLVYFDFDSNEKYRAQVICQINCPFKLAYYNSFIKEWLKKFSTFTNTQWKPALESCRQIKHTKVFKCNITEPHSCKSRIDFKVAGPECSRNNIMVTIDYLDCTSALLEKIKSNSEASGESSSNILLTFYTYFSDSFKPGTAKLYHSLKLLVDKFGNGENFLVNRTMSPTVTDIQMFWNSWKLESAENCPVEVAFNKIKERKIAEMARKGVLMRVQDEEMVFLITPTMKRVLAFYELDVVIISSMDVPLGPHATMFFIPSKMGALCFACVLHKKQSQDAYKKLFNSIKQIIESDFKIKFQPNSIIVHDIYELILAIKIVFEKSRVMIAPWYLCREFWAHICSGNILDVVCHTAMAAFHEIMHAPDAKSAHVRFIKFKTSAEFTYLTKPLQKYFEDVWKKCRLNIWWSNANNGLIELSITLLQQLFLQWCEGFNIMNMCDLITTLDKHFQQLMFRWINNKSILRTHSKFLKSSKLKTTVIISPPHKFLFNDRNLTITMRTDTWCCNCGMGKRAWYCEHLSAIMNLADVTVSPTADEKHLLKQIAGENYHHIEYFDDNYNVLASYNDDYYIFNFPIEVNMQYSNKSIVEGESTSYIKEIPRNSNKIYKHDIDLFADPITEETVNREDSDATNFAGLTIDAEQTGNTGHDTKTIDICPPTSPKIIYQEELFPLNGMEFEDIEMQTSITKEKTIKEELTDEMFLEMNMVNPLHYKSIQRKSISNQDSKINIAESDTKNLNFGDNNLLDECMSHDFAGSSEVFEVEYKSAVDSLSTEFQKLDDYFLMSPSASNLTRILSLTKELDRAIVEIQDIKREPEDLK